MWVITGQQLPKNPLQNERSFAWIFLIQRVSFDYINITSEIWMNVAFYCWKLNSLSLSHSCTLIHFTISSNQCLFWWILSLIFHRKATLQPNDWFAFSLISCTTENRLVVERFCWCGFILLMFLSSLVSFESSPCKSVQTIHPQNINVDQNTNYVYIYLWIDGNDLWPMWNFRIICRFGNARTNINFLNTVDDWGWATFITEHIASSPLSSSSSSSSMSFTYNSFNND